MNATVLDVINQYTLLAVPFVLLVGTFVLSKINMSERWYDRFFVSTSFNLFLFAEWCGSLFDWYSFFFCFCDMPAHHLKKMGWKLLVLLSISHRYCSTLITYLPLLYRLYTCSSEALLLYSYCLVCWISQKDKGGVDVNLHSDKIPEIGYRPDMSKLFMFFGINWDTLSPVLWLLFGTLFAFFIFKVLKIYYFWNGGFEWFPLSTWHMTLQT